MITPREIGEPERRGSTELRPFRYEPAYVGALAGFVCKAFDHRTDVDVSAVVCPGAVTFNAGIITSGQPSALNPEQVLRIHFLFTVDGVPYDDYRIVIVEK